MTSILQAQFRHKTWATLDAIRFCKTLTPEQLQATAPGTYGTVLATLHHLVSADEIYYTALSGQRIGDPIPADSDLTILEERTRRLAPLWESLDVTEDLLNRDIDLPAYRGSGALTLAQVIYHPSDHRTHVASILKSMGMKPPEWDVWGYGQAAGTASTKANP